MGQKTAVQAGKQWVGIGVQEGKGREEEGQWCKQASKGGKRRVV